jgi:hypothetical protein
MAHSSPPTIPSHCYVISGDLFLLCIVFVRAVLLPPLAILIILSYNHCVLSLSHPSS